MEDASKGINFQVSKDDPFWLVFDYILIIFVACFDCFIFGFALTIGFFVMPFHLQRATRLLFWRCIF